MNRSTAWIVLLGFLTIAYMVQLYSPLRTNTDATCFLQMGASASDGLGFVCCQNAQHYPIGYPALIAALDRSGVACSASLIAVNLVALLTGLIAAMSILRKSFAWATQALLFGATATLLNWVMIKHITLPLTDFPYFGLSLLCLSVLFDAAELEYPAKLPRLLAGFILLALAVSVRTVGIALIPAFALAAVSGSLLTRLLRTIRTHRSSAMIAALASVVLGLGGFFVISRTNYFREMLENWVGVSHLAVMRIEDWGELVLNTSMAKAPNWLRSVQLLAGGSCAALLFAAFAKRRRIEVVDIYMVGYLAILFAWPYRDARFWVPVFPLMLGYVGLAIRPLLGSPRLRWVSPIYLAGYSLLGLAALGYSSWLTFSGDQFGDRFGGGVYRDSYRAAMRLAPDKNSKELRIDPQIVRLLERYKIAPAPMRAQRERVAEVR